MARLALICGLGQLGADHVSYIVAAAAGHVPWCNPYGIACVSISATGRTPPETYLFKGLMIPVACGVALYWLGVVRRLRELGAARLPSAVSMSALGVGAALILLVYVVTLGVADEATREFRHILALLVFTLTYLAQLLFARAVARWSARVETNVRRRPLRMLLALLVVALLLGIGSIVSQAVYSSHHLIEDAIEWYLALLLDVSFVASFFVWRMTAQHRSAAPFPSALSPMPASGDRGSRISSGS